MCIICSAATSDSGEIHNPPSYSCNDMVRSATMYFNKKVFIYII